MRYALPFLVLIAALNPVALAAPGNSFTYQGQLKSGGVPSNGSFNLTFTLFDAASGGNQVGGIQTVNGVTVTNGLFTVALNGGNEFGANPFDGGSRFLQISVSGTPLTPRQPVTPTPYASRAGSAEPFQVVGESAYIKTGVPAVPANSNCCTSRLAVGCSDATCQTAVCTQDPYCCNVQWDSLCVGRAQTLCNSCGAVPAADRVLGFGALGDLVGGSENSDVVAFERVNLANNQTELRLMVGDDVSGAAANLDYFTIGANPGGTWTARFVFISDGTCQKPGGGSWAVLSDARAKHDLAPLCGTLDKLLQLHGYSFEYNEEAITSGEGLPGRQIGLVAQEVEQVFPDWVSQDKSGRKVVTERATTALMVESLRELRDEKDRQIKELTDRIEKLEAALKAANASK